MSLFPVEHKGAEKQPGTRSCPTCAKTRPRPEAGSCRGLALPPRPSWRHICPHHPARGLPSKTRTRPNPAETDQGRKPRREDESSAEEQSEPRGSAAAAPLCVPRSPLVLHLGALGPGMGVCLSQGSCSPQRVFPCVFAFSTSSIRKKKLHEREVLYWKATVLFNAQVKHLCASGVLLLVWS